MTANLPPQPEGIIPREAEEEDESGSTVPIGEEQEAPESSDHGTRKRSCSEGSDASSPPTPEDPSTTVEEPITAVPVRAMAPPSQKKLRLPKESSSDSFNLENFDGQTALSSSDDCQFVKESGVADSKNKEVAVRSPSPPVAAHFGAHFSSSPVLGSIKLLPGRRFWKNLRSPWRNTLS